jgi:chromosome partitioning protein
MILSVTNLKGGSGKSTIAINLAVSFMLKGYKTCILDTDTEQRSAMKWQQDREDDLPDVPVFGAEVENLTKLTKELKSTYDVIIIDGAPQLEGHGEIIMVVSDAVIIPLKPSILDYRSTERFIASFRKVKSLKEMQGLELEGCVVINDADDRTLSYKDVAAAISALPEGLFCTIPSLVAFRDCIQEGRGVAEHDKGKAAKSFDSFVVKLINLLNPERKSA